MNFDVEDDIAQWVYDGKRDLPRWAYHGLGIKLHDKQVEAIEALEHNEATFYFLWWANRVGKTTLVIAWHLHGIYYKPEIPEPETDRDFELWLADDYRTLHAAPLGLLATRAHQAITEIIKGTHPAQRDENGNRREAVLGGSFAAAKERDAHGADHMIVKSLNGGVMDFFSTDGGAGRLESMAWRRISWDEWPQQEAADKGTAIRTVLNRLENRASDFDAKILLTGTITPETEHIATEWIHQCQDESNHDWWGSAASRLDNPAASRKAIALAERNFDPEDYARTVLGIPGGVKGRLLPSFMLDPIFDNDLPHFTPPHPNDGVTFEARPAAVRPTTVRRNRRTGDDDPPPALRGRFRPTSASGSPYTYLHVWDVAIAAAANVGHVYRLPADWRFGWKSLPDGQRVLVPIEGVRHVEIPGSRTLTTAEIIHTIEATYLPYGGRIVVDTTDAHGKSIFRELRRAGYPVDDFTFNERDIRRVIRKDAAIHNTRLLLTEGMVPLRDKTGETVQDKDGVPAFDRTVPYGVLRLPRTWRKARDQLSVLRIDDDKQTKDEAMVVLMGADIAYRTRRARTRQVTSQRMVVFGRR